MTTEAAKVAVANGYKAVATLLDEKILLYIYTYTYTSLGWPLIDRDRALF